MKIFILASLFLTAITAFAQTELSVSLPLHSGEKIEFSGVVAENGSATLTNSLSHLAVVEAQAQGDLAIFDLYEMGGKGIEHSQFSLRAGKLEQVREKKINESETQGLYIGNPLSEKGRGALGIKELVGKIETPEQRDERLAPWLNLKEGGIAAGPVNTVANTYGSLLNGTLLPELGEGFRRVRYEDQFWGTGMMISMLEKASAVFVSTHPSLFVYIGAIAHELGGFFPPHKSHQNGLDADVPYLGTKGFESQLERDGSVKKSFLTAQNWDFFRLLMSQRVFDKGKELPAVSMILVDPRLKAHFCEWVKAQDLSAPVDMEILRRLTPTEGHDDHFHLRLRCSPYYPMCLRQNYEPKDTGCS